MFIGLNPSRADEQVDDPTIRRCMGYGRAWGYGGLIVANLFAFRATWPRDLKKAKRPIGRQNDAWLNRLAAGAKLVVAAWGNDGGFMGRDQVVRRRFGQLWCLKVNQSGQPAHPLYQPKGVLPVAYLPD